MTTHTVKNIFIHIISVSIFFLAHATAFAVDSQMLSVTPPLFQLSVLPGDIWQSSIKVVNGNPYPLTVFTEVLNFEATGENGRGKFLPIIDDEPGVSTLAHWITIAEGPHTIPSEQTKDIPLFVEVPKDASPGGHYAAILISTEAPTAVEKDSVRTSQAVTSLFFTRIEGDVVESGDIREFRAIKSFLQRPQAEFSLRFENKGNVHLQPRGSIVIRNMWGTERGVIPVNYQTHFGNVLPKTIRDFNFSWKSDFSITDIGRYEAEATLAYGEDGIKSTTASAHFWVIPVKSTLVTLTVLGLFIWLLVIIVRSYVRRMLQLAGVDITTEKNTIRTQKEELPPKSTTSMKGTYRKVSAPLRSGVLDLRERLSTVEESVDVVRTIISFVTHYKLFFISVLVLIGIFVSTVLYISRATEENKNYTVIIDEGESETVLNAEEIKESMNQ